jgi:hypothetical protein
MVSSLLSCNPNLHMQFLFSQAFCLFDPTILSLFNNRCNIINKRKYLSQITRCLINTCISQTHLDASASSFFMEFVFWHVYVLPPGYFVWPCSPHTNRTEFVTSHNEQKTKAIKCGALQVWPISTLMPLESKRRHNTINNTDWNVSCYCNSKLPKTYTWSDTFILKDGRYTLYRFSVHVVIFNFYYQHYALIY